LPGSEQLRGGRLRHQRSAGRSGRSAVGGRCFGFYAAGGVSGQGGVGGGGAYDNKDTLVIRDSTLAHNEARGGKGANGLPPPGEPAVYFGMSRGGVGGLGLGGGGFNSRSSQVVNSTIAFNEANGGNGGIGGFVAGLCPTPAGLPGDGRGGSARCRHRITAPIEADRSERPQQRTDP
jgi:hypothetical protein